MSAARGIWPIEYSGPLVHIDKHRLPDLDDVMLEVAAELYHAGDIWGWDEDAETRIPGGASEGRVGYFRKNPCACGDGHGFDLGTVPMDDDGQPIGRAARGAFLGVWFE